MNLELADFLTADNIVTLATLATAVAVFILQNLENKRTERRRLTYRLLSRIFEPGPVAEARTVMARWIAEGRRIEHDDVSEEIDRTIISLIDFYDFVCDGVLQGVVDKKIVIEESGGRMERAYRIVSGYVAAREAKLTVDRGKEVRLYTHLRRFLKHHIKSDIEGLGLTEKIETSTLYFSFGSNMSADQMRRRIGEVAFVGKAVIRDHALVFNRKGTYRAGGVASIAPAPGERVFGVLWRVPIAALRKLDEIEDVTAYRRVTMAVSGLDGVQRFAQVYVAIPQGAFEPDAEYLEVLIEGARAAELPAEWIATLESHRPRSS